LLFSGCKVQLNAGLEERDANEILSRLLSNGIVASKSIGEDNTYDLMVVEQQFSAAVDLLESHGLPRKRYSSMGEIFNSEGLVASPMQERARYNFAKSQELSNSIASIPGVMSVDVHIASSQTDSPFDDPIKPSASVMVKMNKDFITEDLIPQIKHLISLGVQEVDYEQVGVILTAVTPMVAEPVFVRVAGLNVHRDSQRTVQVAIGILVLLLVSITGILFRFQSLGRRSKVEVLEK
jgi:type III secretion protein J